MIQTGKKLLAKLATAFVAITLVMGFMIVALDSNLPGMTGTAQASPADDLKLSTQQKAEIESLFRHANEQIKQLKADTHISRRPFARNQAKQQIQELVKQVQTIRTDAIGKVRNQLNPTQQASFDQFTAKIKDARKSRTELLKSLELTKQQKMKIAKTVEQSKIQSWDVLGDSTLSNEQKIKQIKTIKQETNNAIRDQLTAEQQTKLDAWKHN